MLISVFASATGLSQDTVRFYVRKGLLRPATSSLGGRNPYQVFSARDVQAARLIRFAQSLGMPLKDIAEVNDELLSPDVAPARALALMDQQIARLDAKAAELDTLRSYLRAKRQWMADGETGEPPMLDGGMRCTD